MSLMLSEVVNNIFDVSQVGIRCNDTYDDSRLKYYSQIMKLGANAIQQNNTLNLGETLTIKSVMLKLTKLPPSGIQHYVPCIDRICEMIRRHLRYRSILLFDRLGIFFRKSTIWLSVMGELPGVTHSPTMP
jgi:hypothetical protein